MAVHLRLTRHGSTHSPFYWLVAADHRKPRDGRYIEKLGVYDPIKDPSMVDVKEDRIRYWIDHGARPTAAAAGVLRSQKIDIRKPTKKKKKKKKS